MDALLGIVSLLLAGLAFGLFAFSGVTALVPVSLALAGTGAFALVAPGIPRLEPAATPE